MSGVRCQVSGVMSQVSGFRCQVSDVTFHVPCVTCWVSGVICHVLSHPQYAQQGAAAHIELEPKINFFCAAFFLFFYFLFFYKFGFIFIYSWGKTCRSDFELTPRLLRLYWRRIVLSCGFIGAFLGSNTLYCSFLTYQCGSSTLQCIEVQ